VFYPPLCQYEPGNQIVLRYVAQPLFGVWPAHPLQQRRNLFHVNAELLGKQLSVPDPATPWRERDPAKAPCIWQPRPVASFNPMPPAGHDRLPRALSRVWPVTSAAEGDRHGRLRSGLAQVGPVRGRSGRRPARRARAGRPAQIRIVREAFVGEQHSIAAVAGGLRCARFGGWAGGVG